MAKITNDDVKKLAKLSAITMTDDQVDDFKKEIEAILQYVEQLQDIDTDGLEPTTQVTGLENVMRKDEIIDSGVNQEDLLKNVPEKRGSLIKVPKVL